jgi:hypothetical protein
MRKLRSSAAHATSLASYRIKVSVAHLDDLASQGIAGTTVPISSQSGMTGPSRISMDSAKLESSTDRPNRTCSVWVPAPILEAALPAMVNAYTARKGYLSTAAAPELVRCQFQMLKMALSCSVA